MRFLWRKTNRLKQKCLSGIFFVKYPKRILSKFLFDLIRIAAPKRPFSRMKILEENHLTSLNFCNRQKLVRPLQCQKNTETTFSVPCVKDNHSARWVAPRLQKSAVLPLILIHKQPYIISSVNGTIFLQRHMTSVSQHWWSFLFSLKSLTFDCECPFAIRQNSSVDHDPLHVPWVLDLSGFCTHVETPYKLGYSYNFSMP